MVRRVILGLLALLLVAGLAHSFVGPPIHLGYQGESPVGVHRLGTVLYDTDPVGNLVILKRLGGPLFTLQLLTNGAPWLTKCGSGIC